MPLPLPGSVDASGDEAVSGPEESREVGSLLLGDRKLFVGVIDIQLEAVELNGILLEGTANRRADGVDDAGFGDDVVVHIEGIEGAGIGDKRILWMVVRRKQELAIHGPHGELVDLVWLNPTDKTSHADLLVSADRRGVRYRNRAESRFE
jgi:hypothetical protein